MNILFKKAFKFDFTNLIVTEIPLLLDGNDFENYIEELLVDVVEDKRSRRYLFPEFDTGIKTIIKQVTGKKILADENEDAEKINSIKEGTISAAQRLLSCEENAEQKIEHLNREIQKGILIQALIKDGDETIFVITKAEHFDFIDEDNNKKSKGLPIKKKIFKSFAAYINLEENITHAMVCDSNQKISTFWVKDFLELVEVHDNEWNTTKAFEALDNKVFRKIKKDFPEDYMYLRNATVQYFRSNEEFILTDYVQKIVTNYQPADENLKKEKIDTKILSLPEKENFDARFEIKKEVIKKRMIFKLKLTEQLSLEIREDIALDNTITAIIEGGVKYIKIRTDIGYSHFKKQ